jgi:hypothetical protein
LLEGQHLGVERNDAFGAPDVPQLGSAVQRTIPCMFHAA